MSDSQWTRAIKPLSAAVVLLLDVVSAAPLATAATTGANGTHDPSRMIESDGKFYVYSTGGGSKSSADGLTWTGGPGLFAGGNIPQATTSVVSNNQGIWAPDLLYLNGQYYVYYSIANAQNACAIGLITSPTLNPASPNYKWTDHGLVVSNSGSATYCTIDPAPVLDAAGNLWLSWGSGYSHPSSSNTIWVTRLDNATGLVSSSDSATPGHPLEQGHIEASYIYYHSNYYYLFWNSGGCCGSQGSPNSSINYVIHVARSQTITGPFSTSQVFYSSTGSIYGPGQIGIYDKCGANRFTYHYYPATGGSVLGENELSWDANGWPVVGAESTTPLTPCGQTGGGGATDAGGAGGTRDSGTSGGGSAATADASDGATGGGPPAASDEGGGSSGATSGSSSNGGAPTGSSSGGIATGTGSGSSGSGSSGTSGAGSGGLPDGGLGTTDRSSGSGCSCTVGGGRGSNGAAGGLLFSGVALEGARRRRRRQLQR